MAEPTAAPRILLFSRGRGHGHAIPDLSIIKEWKASNPDFHVVVASYATGAETFRRLGHPVVDLCLPERNPFLETLRLCAKLISRERPDIVVAHEEFAAVSAATVFDVPCIYFAAWLPPPTGILAEAVSQAKSVIVMEDPGIFEAPKQAQFSLTFTGPLYDKPKHTAIERTSIRADLGFDQKGLVVTVVQGGHNSEESSPMAELVVDAMEGISGPKRLIWLAGDDAKSVRSMIGNCEFATILEFSPNVHQFLAMSDIVITKATRGATFEAHAVGVPTISLSPRTNPIDDLLVSRIRTNIPLVLSATSSETLRHYIDLLIDPNYLSTLSFPKSRSSSLPRIAHVLASEINRFSSVPLPHP